MSSLSPKGSDLKKSTQKVLSPSNGPADKAVAKSPLKSPPSKLSSKSPISKATEPGKTSIKNKMDSSPPKVARSPSAKSITPPSKTTKSLLNTGKPPLDKSNSQGDIAVPSLKNGIGEIVPLDNPNEVTNTAEAKPSEPASETNTTETEPESKLDEGTSLSNGDVSELCKLAEKPISEQNLDSMAAEQKHASGDSAVTDKPEKESAGESAFVEAKPDKLENYENFTQHLPSSGVTLTVIKTETVETEPKTQHTEPEIKDEVKEEPETDSAENTTNNASTPKKSSDVSATDTENADCSAETAKLTDEPAETENAAEDEISKQSYRSKVWNKLESEDLVLFPRPCKGRIPNFKGAHQAAEKLAASKVFKGCKTIKVNPDKAQEMVRFHILEHGKRLLVPIPRLHDGLFQAVVPPTDASKYQLQQASQRFGMKKWSKPFSLDDKVTIDMVVLGSVAVDKKGHRIGKGEGFADLEFAMLTKMNAINENTVIVTTVHDDQVFEELPEELFKEHDVPVDWIVTPTQIIEVADRLARPKGIIWSILSNRRILEIPILQKLREQEMNDGAECILKEVDSDVEEKAYPAESVFKKRFMRRRRFNNYSRSTGDPIRDSKLATAPAPFYNRSRRYSPNQNRVRDYDGRRYDGAVHDGRRYDAPHNEGRRYDGPNEGRRYDGSNEPRRYDAAEGRRYDAPNDGRRYDAPAHDGRRYDAPAQDGRRYDGQSRRNYYQVPYGMKQMNNRAPMRQNRQGNGQMAGAPRNMSRSQGPRMNRQHSDSRQPNSMTKSVEVQTVDKNVRGSRPFIKRKRAPIEFSLRVKNIGTGVRVRDLKSALNERGIKPRDITWRGYRGFAFLHFVKAASKENKPLAVEDVINALEGLPLPPKNKKALVIEAAKPKKSESESNSGEESNADVNTMTSATITLDTNTSVPVISDVVSQTAINEVVCQPVLV